MGFEPYHEPASELELEFLLRHEPRRRVALQEILCREGDVVAHGEKAEEAEGEL